ncbi:MAG: hypothetical protein ACLTE2_09590 [Eubacteriales bacterium]
MGKGVIIAENLHAAKMRSQSIMEDKTSGQSGNKL